MLTETDFLHVVAADAWAIVAENQPDIRVAALINFEQSDAAGSDEAREQAMAASVSATINALGDAGLSGRPFVLVAPQNWRDMFHRLAPAKTRFWLMREFSPVDNDDAEDFASVELCQRSLPLH